MEPHGGFSACDQCNQTLVRLKTFIQKGPAFILMWELHV